MWNIVGGEHSLKISAPQFVRFGIDSVFKILNTTDDRLIEWLNQLMAMVYVEHPWLYKN